MHFSSTISLTARVFRLVAGIWDCPGVFDQKQANGKLFHGARFLDFVEKGIRSWSVRGNNEIVDAGPRFFVLSINSCGVDREECQQSSGAPLGYAE